MEQEPDFAETRRAGAAVLDAFGRLNAAKQEAEAAFAALPRFLRGVAESAMGAEIARQTGQDLSAWAVTIGGLTRQIEAARARLDRAENGETLGPDERDRLRRLAGELDTEGARLGRLLRFMEEGPAKIERLARQLLNAGRRQMALDNLRVQTQALRDALEAMPALARGLRRSADAERP